MYAQAGHGRRSGWFTDYTLGAWSGGRLVPVAKAYSGLTDAEIRQLDRWIKQHTLARRGPVRTVPAEQVFEIGFEGVQPSSRHKSGIALRFPRVLRWRHDKPTDQADTVEQLAAMA
jgi:DNA ligase-1